MVRGRIRYTQLLGRSVDPSMLIDTQKEEMFKKLAPELKAPGTNDKK